MHHSLGNLPRKNSSGISAFTLHLQLRGQLWLIIHKNYQIPILSLKKSSKHHKQYIISSINLNKASNKLIFFMTKLTIIGNGYTAHFLSKEALKKGVDVSIITRNIIEPKKNIHYYNFYDSNNVVKKLAKKCLEKGTLENNTIFLHSFALNHSFLSVPETVSEGFVLKKKRNDKSRMCVLSTRNWDMLLSIYLTSLHSFTACFLHSFLNFYSLLFFENFLWKSVKTERVNYLQIHFLFKFGSSNWIKSKRFLLSD